MGYHRCKTNEATHLLLNGGKWQIPDTKTAQTTLIKLLAQDAERAELAPGDQRDPTYENFVVEKRTELYPYILDLDVDAEAEVGESTWKRLYALITRTLATYYPTISARRRALIVCRAPCKQRTKNDRLVIKSGRHCVAPWLLIDNETGLRLRAALIEAYLSDNNADTRIADIDAEDLFDKCIYQRNGMRMLYSRKADPCKTCKVRRRSAQRAALDVWLHQGKDRASFHFPYQRYEDCVDCAGVGFILENRAPYKPYRVYTWDTDHHTMARLRDYEERVQTDATFALTLTSVRRVGATLTPLDSDALPTIEHIRRQKRRRDGTGISLPAADRFRHDQWSWTQLRNDDALAVELGTWLVRAFPVPAHCAPHQIDSLKRSDNHRVAIILSTSHYCINREREHTHAGVYFQITRRGAQQRCYSGKGGRFGPCAEFHSEIQPLPRPLLDRLLDPERAASADETTGVMADSVALSIPRENITNVLQEYRSAVQQLGDPPPLTQANARARQTYFAKLRRIENNYVHTRNKIQRMHMLNHILENVRQRRVELRQFHATGGMEQERERQFTPGQQQAHAELMLGAFVGEPR